MRWRGGAGGAGVSGERGGRRHGGGEGKTTDRHREGRSGDVATGNELASLTRRAAGGRRR